MSLFKKMLSKLMKLKSRKRQARQLQESNARIVEKLKKSPLLKWRKSLQKALPRQNQTKKAKIELVKRLRADQKQRVDKNGDQRKS